MEYSCRKHGVSTKEGVCAGKATRTSNVQCLTACGICKQSVHLILCWMPEGGISTREKDQKHIEIICSVQ